MAKSQEFESRQQAERKNLSATADFGTLSGHHNEWGDHTSCALLGPQQIL
jgi:hypothetical protein